MAQSARESGANIAQAIVGLEKRVEKKLPSRQKPALARQIYPICWVDLVKT